MYLKSQHIYQHNIASKTSAQQLHNMRRLNKSHSIQLLLTLLLIFPHEINGASTNLKITTILPSNHRKEWSLTKQNYNYRQFIQDKNEYDKIYYNLRGGNINSNTQPPSSTFWSTKTSRQNPPKSSYGNIKVTDVTQDIKEQEMEETKDEIDKFLTRDSRVSFISRVYAILTGQLVILSLSILAFAKNPKLSFWIMSKGRVIPMICLLISTISVSIMSMSERARHSSPLKWQLLSLFTIGEAIVVGWISSFYRSKTVISAMLSTALATLSVTMYTLMNPNPKYDLSQWGPSLSSIGMIFVFYGFIHLLSSFGILPPGFLPYNDIIYSLLGTSLFTMYLAYHTRLIISGKHTKYQLNEKDYVFGAVLLYNDIINIFLYLLRLLDGGNGMDD